MKVKLFLSLIFFLIFFSETAYALYLGVAPGLYDLGELQRGSKKRLDIYIISDTTKEIPVSLKFVRPDLNALKSSGRVKAEEISEENIEPWFDLMGGTFTIPPEKKFYKEVNLFANKKHSIILTIPQNAEPGYHAAEIEISPKISPPQRRAPRVEIITTARLVVLFKVPGEAKRDGKILDFMGERISKDFERVRVFFKNTGTVTIQARLKELSIIDNEKVVAKNYGSSAYIKPGDIVSLSTITNIKGLKDGREYNVSAKVSYGTGELQKNGTVFIQKYIEKAKPVKVKAVFPWWLIVMIIIVMIVIIYLVLRWVS